MGGWSQLICKYYTILYKVLVTNPSWTPRDNCILLIFLSPSSFFSRRYEPSLLSKGRWALEL